MFEMSNVTMLTNQHLREVLIFCFHWKKNMAEAYRTLVEVYGDTAPTDKSCREWFRRFKDGDFALKTSSEQPKKFEDKELEALLEEDRSHQMSIRRSNARGTCIIIGSNSTNRFYTIESHGYDSKTRKLDAL